MSLAFLSPDGAAAADAGAPVARSPMERAARSAGARLQPRGGWSVAVDYGSVDAERRVLRQGVGWCDLSHLGKLELQAPAGDLPAIVADVADGAALESGTAVRAADASWCRLSSTRAIAICELGATATLRGRLEAATEGLPRASVADLTAAYAALAVAGPLARDVFARFTALDLRPQALPLHGFRPGSIARTPGMLLRESRNRFLFWFGAALGEYMWTVVADAALHAGGAPVGVAALARPGGALPAVEEAARHA